jgi:hypothetical protein
MMWRSGRKRISTHEPSSGGTGIRLKSASAQFITTPA